MLRLFIAILFVGFFAACDSKTAEPVSNNTAEVNKVVETPVEAERSSPVVIPEGAPEPPTPAMAAKPVPTAVSKPINQDLYQEGKHYTKLSRPIPTSDPSQIEIAEFFWYGCSHCYSFEPSLNAYKKTLPANIKVVPVPAMWQEVMVVHAKAYYAAQALNKPELHNAMFKAMNVDRKRLASVNEVASLFAEYGVDKEQALKVLNSFGVGSQVNKAKSLAAGARISGTPSLVVNGKYMVETRTAGSQAGMLKIADYLARQEAGQ